MGSTGQEEADAGATCGTEEGGGNLGWGKRGTGSLGPEGRGGKRESGP